MIDFLVMLGFIIAVNWFFLTLVWLISLKIKDVGIEYKKVSSELPLVSRSRIRPLAVSVDTRANFEHSSFVAVQSNVAF